jgi:Tn3 transposase DDE domain
MRRRVDRLSLEKKLSTMSSHEPCLGYLVIAAIVYWNSTYIADAVAHLQGKEDPDDALLAHTTPLTWEHIGFSGDFLWERAAATASKRRPLNLRHMREAA